LRYGQSCAHQSLELPRHHLFDLSKYNCISEKSKTDTDVHKTTQPPSKPDPGNAPSSSDRTIYLDGVGTFDLISLPPRHLLWTFVLALLNRNFPGVWDAEEFTEGVEAAVMTVYRLLAAGDLPQLDGLVEKQLLESFLAGKKVEEKERWGAPPSMTYCKLLGLLHAEGIEAEESQGRRFRVTPLLCSDEEYTYSAQADIPKTIRRIHSWTFERKLDEGDHWSVVGISAKHWYCSDIE